MPKKTVPCFYCSKPAEYLCDHQDRNGPCDRPLCREHAKWKGNVFFDGSPKSTRVDTFDLCPHHAGQFLTIFHA